jgi:hypothetical protein
VLIVARLCSGFVIALFLFSCSAFAQIPIDVDLGIRGGLFNSGIPIEAEDNHYFHNQYSTEKHPVTIGPAVGVLLNNSFGVRFEAVRSQFRFHGQSGLPVSGSKQTLVADGYIWQYPILATYHVGPGRVRAFGGAGLSLGRSIHTSTYTVTPTLTSATTLSTTFRLQSDATAFYVTAGVDCRVSLFSVRPEFRYAHWSASLANQDDSILYSPNQLEFLVGITVHPFPHRDQAHGK